MEEKTDSFCSENQHLGSKGKLLKIIVFITAILLVIHFSLLALGLYFQVKINRQQTQRFNDIDERLEILEEEIMGSFAFQKEIIENEHRSTNSQIISSAEHLEEVIRNQTGRTINTIAATDRNINRIEQVYGDLLEEQKKKTLESLYEEEALLERFRNAGILLKEGKYRQAHDEYAIVANEQPENLDAQFYQYYTLFLRNKGDQSQYRRIRTALLGLERRGYAREEIKEVLEYISGEEGYMGEENIPLE